MWRGLRGRPQESVRWSLNTRAILIASAWLSFGGAALLMLFGVASRPEAGWFARAVHALFQSVTCRTAGFNSVNIAACPLASLIVMTFLMFVGGSPGSCAGGVKTTSLALGWGFLRSSIRGRSGVDLLGRVVSADLARRALLVALLAATWTVAGVILLSITQAGKPYSNLQDLLFEQVSAFGTVGLSTGTTPLLTPLGKMWIILTMYVGRVGPLTLAIWALQPKDPGVRYAEERIMIG
ncbi:MAG: hypothetical protein NTW86_25630 [Candidatus Sumerlaeota bacterium]|nr:hypothetical protein [Candidatus Sumerlaeota bacterium]